MVHENLKRFFLSYSSENIDEVLRFDREMRLRGVPLWRDRVNLKPGRDLEKEIKQATGSAAGFVAYLTEQAARSKWVREKELTAAFENARNSDSFGIVPIFREDRKTLLKRLRRLGRNPAVKNYLPALANRSGYEDFSGKDQKDSLRRAADHVLGSLLATLDQRAESDQVLRVGLATRGGPLLRQSPLDLLVDWSTEFPESNKEAVSYLPTDQKKGPPKRLVCNRDLFPALESLKDNIADYWRRGLELRVVPHCHLSMALAFGFTFRRNTGFSLEIISPNTGDRWLGPRQPKEPATEAWRTSVTGRRLRSEALAIAINVSRTSRRLFKENLRKFLSISGLGPARLVVLELAKGPGPNSLVGSQDVEAHRMAVAVFEEIVRHKGESGAKRTHLFYAGPVALAILIGQQLSNVGEVQTYEWLDSKATYAPSFLLSS